MGLAYPGLGERVEEKIQELGYPSHRQFSLARGYPPNTINDMVSRGRLPSYDTFQRLCVDFHCTRAWLMFGDDANKIPGKKKMRLAAKKKK